MKLVWPEVEDTAKKKFMETYAAWIETIRQEKPLSDRESAFLDYAQARDAYINAGDYRFTRLKYEA